VFQSARVGVTTKMNDNVILFLMGVHCFAYWTNLVVLVFIKVEFNCSIGGPPLGFIWVFLSFI
jgi:hypothetical protein